jgi:hypothetical protein
MQTGVKFGIVAAVLFCAIARFARADDNLAGFRHIGAAAEGTAGDFGPVETENVSLINAAPILLPYFNNGPVFGVPGTVLGGLRDRTQLTGDWGGRRTELARRGLFFDLYSTSAWQDVTSGGLKTGSSFVNIIQMPININSGRSGLFWRAGYAPKETNTITAHASVGLFAHGFMPSRRYDSVGVGFDHNAINSDTWSLVSLLMAGAAKNKTPKRDDRHSAPQQVSKGLRTSCHSGVTPFLIYLLLCKELGYVPVKRCLKLGNLCGPPAWGLFPGAKGSSLPAPSGSLQR